MYGSADVTNDNWKGSTQTGSNVKATSRWTDGLTALSNEQTAEEAFETVLAKAGCSLSRDAIDTRIVNEVRNGGGKLVNSPDEAGGYPKLEGGTTPVDTDHDGMPDDWENANGLDRLSPNDGKLNTIDQNYTNLEVYLNSLVQNLF